MPIDLTQFEGHTPGPWAWRDAEWRGDYQRTTEALTAGGVDILDLGLEPECASYGGRTGEAPSDADARLIAAAPDLLALCREQAETIKAERARGDRLTRILAVERGDASAAPSGWTWAPHAKEWTTPPENQRMRVASIRPGSWLWEVYWLGHVSVYGTADTALEAMEAADAARGE